MCDLSFGRSTSFPEVTSSQLKKNYSEVLKMLLSGIHTGTQKNRTVFLIASMIIIGAVFKKLRIFFSLKKKEGKPCTSDFVSFLTRKKMEDTLDQVRQKCALQLEMYQKCIENYPHTWDKSCMQQKKALTKCSEDK